MALTNHKSKMELCYTNEMLVRKCSAAKPNTVQLFNLQVILEWIVN